MTRPAIVYLHGFRSSPASAKAAALRAGVDALPAALRPVLEIPALVPGPAAAITQAAALVERHLAAGAGTSAGISSTGRTAAGSASTAARSAAALALAGDERKPCR